MQLVEWLKNKYFTKRVESLLSHADDLDNRERYFKIFCKYGGIRARDWLIDRNYRGSPLYNDVILALLRIGDDISLKYVFNFCNVNEHLVNALGAGYCPQYQKMLMQISVDPDRRYGSEIKSKAVEILCKDTSMVPFLKGLLRSADSKQQTKYIEIYGNHPHLIYYLYDIIRDKTDSSIDHLKYICIRQIWKYDFMIPSLVEILLETPKDLQNLHYIPKVLQDTAKLLQDHHWFPRTREECLAYSYYLFDVSIFLEYIREDLKYLSEVIEKDDISFEYRCRLITEAIKRYSDSVYSIALSFVEKHKESCFKIYWPYDSPGVFIYIIYGCIDFLNKENRSKIISTLKDSQFFEKLDDYGMGLLRHLRDRGDSGYNDLLRKALESEDISKKISACEVIDKSNFIDFEDYLADLLVKDLLSSVNENPKQYEQGRLVPPALELFSLKNATAMALKRIGWQPKSELEQTYYYFFNRDFPQISNYLVFVKELLNLSKRNPFIIKDYLIDFIQTHPDKELRILLIKELEAINSTSAKGKKEVGWFPGTIDDEYYAFAEQIISTIAEIGGDDMQDTLIFATKNKDLDYIHNDIGYGLRVFALRQLKNYLNDKTINLYKEILKSNDFHLKEETLYYLLSGGLIEMVDDVINLADKLIESEDLENDKELSYELRTTMDILRIMRPNVSELKTKDEIDKLKEKLDNKIRISRFR